MYLLTSAEHCNEHHRYCRPSILIGAFLLFTLVAPLALVIRNQQPKLPIIVHVACSCNVGDPTTADARIAYLLLGRLMNTSGVESIITVSTRVQTDIYLTVRTGSDPSVVLCSINQAVREATGYLPSDAALSPASILGTERAIPSLGARDVDTIKVAIHRDKLSAAGMTSDEFDCFLTEACRGIGSTSLAMTKLAAVRLPLEKSHLTVGDVATISIEKSTDRIVRVHSCRLQRQIQMGQRSF